MKAFFGIHLKVLSLKETAIVKQLDLGYGN
jgi:hypothetical protein